jgi:hypothetical protein
MKIGKIIIGYLFASIIFIATSSHAVELNHCSVSCPNGSSCDISSANAVNCSCGGVGGDATCKVGLAQAPDHTSGTLGTTDVKDISSKPKVKSSNNK